MIPQLLLDQSALKTFEICPRRFQLRYIEHLPWPSSPLDRQQSQAVARGRYFHRLVEQWALGLPVDADTLDDEVVRGWWRRFEGSNHSLPGGDRWPEHRLTIPVGRHFLTGRFDLLILGEESGRPFARLYDWKTSHPRSTADLALDWQTRLYLALITESRQALRGAASPLQPEDVSITYWYPREPDQPRVLSYDAGWHERNWREINGLVASIDRAISKNDWPLTDNLNHCRSCMYQAYCGRQDAGTATYLAEESADYEVETASLLEPELP